VSLFGDGRVLVGAAHELLALLPSGRIDPSFGEGGYARYVGPNAEGAAVTTVAVDPRGRPIVLGSAAVGQAPEGFEPFIERFTAAGTLDREFGEGSGYLASGLGLPPPAYGESPQASLEQVSFASLGHIVLRGRSRIGTRLLRFTELPTEVEESFLARLGESGQLDTSFADGGLFLGLTNASRWAVAPGGSMVVSSPSAQANSILRLSEGGVPDEGFGAGGYFSNPAGTTRDSLLVDSMDRTIAYSYVQGVRHRLPNGLLIRRLLSDGSRDPSFGTGGAIRVRISRFDRADLALDDHDRILMAVSLKERGEFGEPNGLALVRLRTDGRVDRSFGHDGMIRVPFPEKPDSSVEMEGIDVRGDQVAISATYCPRLGNCRPSVALVDLGSG
jgi:uncharacterized delta-60 repeat protein